jgi:hypothetical protein
MFLPYFATCDKTMGRIRIWMHIVFDANPDPDLDRHHNGNSDSD